VFGDAAAHPDDLVLDPLAQPGQLGPVDEQVGAGQVAAALAQERRGPGDVADPLRSLGAAQRVDRPGVGGVQPARDGAQQPVGATSDRDVGAQVQGGTGSVNPSL
jgi:hypothetical protein